MSRSASPLPPQLAGAFTWQQARDAGVSARRLRHPSLHRAPQLRDAFTDVSVRATGRRGIRSARAAAAQIRPGVLSPQETLWRLRFVRSGLPEPRLNLTVVDDHGAWLGIGDFVWPDHRLVAEYDGDYHFTVDQRRHDQQRRRAMRHGGWTVIEINGADNRDPGPALAAIAAALRGPAA